MVNRAKGIGTWTESAVVAYVRRNGFEQAERLALAGAQDKGDIRMCPGFILEVKGGKAAENASDATVIDWLGEAEREAVNGGNPGYMLVMKRKAHGITRIDSWWAALWLGDWLDGGTDASSPAVELSGVPCRLLLRDALKVARVFGYGSPLGIGESIESTS